MAYFAPASAADFTVRQTINGPVQGLAPSPYIGNCFTHNFLHLLFSYQILTPVYLQPWNTDYYRIEHKVATSLFMTNIMIARYILAAANNFNPTFGDSIDKILPSSIPPEFYESLDMPPPPQLPFRYQDENPLHIYGSYEALKILFEKHQQLGRQALIWIEEMKERCYERNDENWHWPEDMTTLPTCVSSPPSRPSRIPGREMQRKNRRKRQQRKRANLSSRADIPPLNTRGFGSLYEGPPMPPPPRSPTSSPVPTDLNYFQTRGVSPPPESFFPSDESYFAESDDPDRIMVDAAVQTNPVIPEGRKLRRRKRNNQRRRLRRANKRSIAEIPPRVPTGWETNYAGPRFYSSPIPSSPTPTEVWGDSPIDSPMLEPEELQESNASIPPARAALIVDDERPTPEIIITRNPSPPSLISSANSSSSGRTYETAPLEVQSTSTALILHPIHSNYAIENSLSALVPINTSPAFTPEEIAFIYHGLGVKAPLDS
ncbi:hypothetical protein BD410DRAFT_844108 [Rickenella mellea]|uniref:Uncharacterized protein n=1 Tax=Rickenella mellea TaxID=50990 RepID=A0A4Y7PQK7_9AGAM|nr:hypothetical protein BD410DRAFT_844108 [Rickenella mellea]